MIWKIVAIIIAVGLLAVCVWQVVALIKDIKKRKADKNKVDTGNSSDNNTSVDK